MHNPLLPLIVKSLNFLKGEIHQIFFLFLFAGVLVAALFQSVGPAKTPDIVRYLLTTVVQYKKRCVVHALRVSSDEHDERQQERKPLSEINTKCLATKCFLPDTSGGYQVNREREAIQSLQCACMRAVG